MTLSNFEDLEIWKLSRTLSKDIYQITNSQEFKSDIRFCSQIRAAVGSIMDNIAEGFEREGKKEFIQFLYVAKGSCGEVRSQLYRATDAGYISTEQCNSLLTQTKKVGSKISNMIRYLKQSDVEGYKFKK
jgi:four helix bundle protein